MFQRFRGFVTFRTGGVFGWVHEVPIGGQLQDVARSQERNHQSVFAAKNRFFVSLCRQICIGCSRPGMSGGEFLKDRLIVEIARFRVIGSDSSVRLHALLAALSASSLPGIPMWPGIHCILIACLRESKVRLISEVLGPSPSRAVARDWLSVQIMMTVSRSQLESSIQFSAAPKASFSSSKDEVIALPLMLALCKSSGSWDTHVAWNPMDLDRAPEGVQSEDEIGSLRSVAFESSGLGYTQFTYADESMRRSLLNAATPKPGQFEKEWVELDLAATIMERESRPAGGCTDSHECEAKVDNNWEAAVT